ncbi:MAG: GGDEF domain-containing protein [Porticoccaceae bacterium]|uniref:GGDEF domain-containing protein n=1 Tax=Thalassospira sp. TaxID=1912094 RepID=UPI003A8BDC95
MDKQDEYRQQSRRLSRHTLALIDELGVCASPINYAVFYAYLEMSNDGLVLAIDILRSNKRAFDDLQCHELYLRYLDPTRDQISAGIANPHMEAKADKGLQDQSSDEVSKLRDDLEKLKREALTDGLTGIANRKAFDEKLRDAAMATMESGQDLSVLLIDADFFKQINDLYGHQAGDQVIRVLAQTLQQNVKGRDTTARYGGEEFAIILPTTKLDDAIHVAENIRQSVEGLYVVSENRGEDIGKITVSIGVASFQMGEPLSRLLERADQALYLAKTSGRNQVMSEDDLYAGATNIAARA